MRRFCECWSGIQSGSPIDESVKWTHLKRHEIAGLLNQEGIEVSVTVVD
ncbi:hypothetical protein [Nostoc sp.]